MMKDKDFEINAERYAEHLDKQWGKLLTEIEWSELRDRFFLECVWKRDGKLEVYMSPDKIVKWFQLNVGKMEKPV